MEDLTGGRGSYGLANFANVMEGCMQSHASEGRICISGVWALPRPPKSFGVFMAKYVYNQKMNFIFGV